MADQDKNPRIWTIEEGQAYFDDLIRLLRNPNVSVDETADTGHINATANHFPFQFQKGAPVTKAKACCNNLVKQEQPGSLFIYDNSLCLQAPRESQNSDDTHRIWTLCNGLRVTSLSVACSTLVQELRRGQGIQYHEYRNIISLVFYCGREPHQRGVSTGLLMIRSLLAQIFEYIRVFIIEYKDVISGGHEFREEVETDDLGQLCGMLDIVIRTLPPVKDHEQPERRIVCFIDGVGSRSDVEDSSGVAKVIQTLLKMVRLSHTGNDYVPTFQLICTSPRLGDWDDALFPNGDTCQIIDLALPLLASAPST
ncbi:hypothetical protein CABS01_06375 [Colletotrichum abscissum]|uniref:Uncharacterized protein n=1 Tax=Colletotrichum abscissum TaxID=1671311 RepID=A0A9P9XGN1_9PEZI|nr:uncharacterized protein CABS01_06375 [Colletotrichum abscissum]KAI3552867.1 hypothetical protein CABS02_06872 [Colletotrichum abscissum]KAK1516408.1 hypothetical protein CABS01_06375 [Colletotrichum abscissum]